MHTTLGRQVLACMLEPLVKSCETKNKTEHPRVWFQWTAQVQILAPLLRMRQWVKQLDLWALVTLSVEWEQ